jgi:fatty acid desaturase
MRTHRKRLVFYLTEPDPKDDSYFRRFQHLYALPVYSFLYFSWRQQSLVYAWGVEQNVIEMTLITIHYSAMVTLVPYSVFLGAIAFGGFCVAVVVTATHQSEDFYTPENRGAYDFVTAQFTTTRDAYNSSWLARWFWGGMDTQLEHHLFPLMPQYYYHSLVPVIQEFAKANNIEYRTEPSLQLLARNLRTMKRVADASVASHNLKKAAAASR